MTEILRHNRIELVLHTLKDGEGLPILLLHGLGECSPTRLPPEYANWQGPVHSLDFSGHGLSGHPTGGGYTCEYLMADVDTALAWIGPSTIAGRGLGAYIALLIAGARPRQVRGAILCDGPGLTGGGGASPITLSIGQGSTSLPDPFAIAELSVDLRPPAYAAGFAVLAAKHSGLAAPIFICALEQPDWMIAVMDALTLQRISVDSAVSHVLRLAKVEDIPNMRES